MTNLGFIINENIERATKEQVNLFKGMAVANIDDSMNRTAAVSSEIKPFNKEPLLGTAFTVKVAQGDNLMFHKAMDMAQEGDVVVIDAGGFTDRAILGELMLHYCEVRKLNGVIVDGSVRDVDAIAEMKLAVYGRGVSPNGPYKNGPGEIGTTISFGGQFVQPGDIVVGDADGIVFIRPDQAEELAEKVKEVERKEAEILDGILNRKEYIRPWVDELLEKNNCTYISGEGK